MEAGGWKSGSTLWCCGRNRFQMVSVTIWGQHHQWIINESSICLQSWEIWEMPPVHTGDWLLNAVKLPHECYICQILYGWSHCSETNLYRYHQKHPQSPKKKGMARNYRKCVCKKTHDTWLNLRIRRIRLTCTRHQNAVSVACNHCERMLPRSHEIAVLLVSRHMVRVPGESIWRLPDSIDARAGRTWENNCSWNETLRWKSSEITWRCTLFIEDL